MDSGWQRPDSSQGTGIPPYSFRNLLPTSSRHAFGLPPQMASTAAIPADTWSASDAGPMALFRLQGFIYESSSGASHYFGFRSAGMAEFPSRCVGAAGRKSFTGSY